MKIKYHIHLNGPEIGALPKLLEMIASNNSSNKQFSLYDFHHICMADKVLYPSLHKNVDYILDEEEMELVCIKPDSEDIHWVIISCDVYELSEDNNGIDFSNN